MIFTHCFIYPHHHTNRINLGQMQYTYMYPLNKEPYKYVLPTPRFLEWVEQDNLIGVITSSYGKWPEGSHPCAHE